MSNIWFKVLVDTISSLNLCNSVRLDWLPAENLEDRTPSSVFALQSQNHILAEAFPQKAEIEIEWHFSTTHCLFKLLLIFVLETFNLIYSPWKKP